MKTLTLFFLLSVQLLFCQVPNTTSFSFLDVKTEIESKSSATINSLVDAFAAAKETGFDTAYKGSKNSLSNFRNYTHPSQATFSKQSITVVSGGDSCTTYFVYIGSLTNNNVASIKYERIDGNYTGNVYINGNTASSPIEHEEVILTTNSDSVTRTFTTKSTTEYSGEISFSTPPTADCGGIGWSPSDYIVLRFTLISLSVNGVPTSNVFTHIVGNAPE